MANVVPVTCNPSRLVFGDLTSTQVVKVKLPRKPTGTVDVFYNSPSLIFKQCLLRFTPNDWDKEKELTISPSPLVEPAEAERDLVIKFTSASRDASYHNKVFDYPLQRPPSAGAICTGSGDPHYKSFGGKTFDYQGEGCHYYVKSQRLTVMAILTKHKKHTNVSVNTGLAIRYGKSRWLFRRESGAKLASANTVGMTITADASKKNYRITVNDGAVISLVMNAWEGEDYLDVTVTLPHHYKGQCGGLCGDIDNNQWLKAPGRPSDTTNDVNQFGASWKVPQEDDIFSCVAGKCTGDYELKVPAAFHRCNVPTLGATYDRPYEEKDGVFILTGYIEQPPAPTDNPADRKPLPPAKGGPPPPVKLDEKCFEEKTKLCKQILTCTANELIDPSQKVKECAYDACVTQSIAPFEASKRIYQSRVFERIQSILSDNIPADRKAALQKYLDELYLSSQLKKTPPPNPCKNGGKWSPLGCLCAAPWSGKDCSIKCA